jgi:hypothetical protein
LHRLYDARSDLAGSTNQNAPYARKPALPPFPEEVADSRLKLTLQRLQGDLSQSKVTVLRQERHGASPITCVILEQPHLALPAFLEHQY